MIFVFIELGIMASSSFFKRSDIPINRMKWFYFNVSEWSEISIVDYCFTIGIQLSMFI
jgi:hypothetical protein